MKKTYTLLLVLSVAGSLRAEDWKLIWVTKVSPELDEEFEDLSGTYRKLTHSGRLGCIEEIQLMNQYEYVGLFREFECKP
jgi:hypothetical protein